MNYINIHRHGPAPEGEFGIENFGHSPAGYFSAGLHPWFISNNTWENEIENLKNISANNAMLAIGECGLDKVCDTDYALQKVVFAEQIKLANTIDKPLIIHCVKAYDDVMQLLKIENIKVPVIFHGFNKSIELARSIISKGYFLSFGKALSKTTMQQVFAAIPLQHLFLETDDSNIAIGKLYEMASEIKKISIDELSLQLQINAEKVFKIKI